MKNFVFRMLGLLLGVMSLVGGIGMFALEPDLKHFLFMLGASYMGSMFLLYGAGLFSRRADNLAGKLYRRMSGSWSHEHDETEAAADILESRVGHGARGAKDGARREKTKIEYPPAAHAVNILFIIALAVLPILAVQFLPGAPEDFLVGTLMFSFGMLVFTIGDWYCCYYTNSWKGCAWSLLIGATVAGATFLLRFFTTDVSALELVSPAHPAWRQIVFLLRLYVVGLGFSLMVLVSLPRLALIRLLTRKALPEATDSI